jgi:adenosine deaminase
MSSAQDASDTDLSELPKVELHCHLLGVITPALLSRMQSDGDPALVDPKVLQAAYPIFDVTTFKRWIETLKPYQTATADAMRPILAAHISDLIAQRVMYTEIMVSPTMFPGEPGNLLTAFQRWREWALELEQGRIQIEFLMVVPRTLAGDILIRDTQNLLTLGRAGLIVGVALVGVETGESIRRFASALERWRDAGLGIEIHAGEHAGPESVYDALDFGRPHRLGHALAAFQDAELIARIGLEKVHLEFCLASNLRTAAVTHLEDHPARQARRLGLSFSLNTDDPGTFSCSMHDEYRLAADTFGFEAKDFQAIFRDSLAARFQPALRYLSDGWSQTRRMPTANR